MHLGHPEYEPERLVFEYERDQAAGRRDVQAPQNSDTRQPTLTWQSHRAEFFRRWLQSLRGEQLLARQTIEVTP